MEPFAWTVIGVVNAGDDACRECTDESHTHQPSDSELIIPFTYTAGLFEAFELSELWCSMLGRCGHTVGMVGMTYVLNTIANKLILQEVTPGGIHEQLFNSGAVLAFELGLPETGVQEKYQTYRASRDAPVLPLTWRCCPGKELQEMEPWLRRKFETGVLI